MKFNKRKGVVELKNGKSVYNEVRAQAKKVYQEMEAYKASQASWSIFIQEKEDGKVDVELFLSVKYHYENNLTKYATADRMFKATIVEDCTPEVAEKVFAKHVKQYIEENTVNKHVTVRFIEHEDIDWL
jgi:hypothetical protein